MTTTSAHHHWVCITKTSSKFEAEAIIGNLTMNEIPAIMLNKQDSSYLAFGYIEIHIPEIFKEKAQEVLQNQH